MSRELEVTVEESEKEVIRQAGNLTNMAIEAFRNLNGRENPPIELEAELESGARALPGREAERLAPAPEQLLTGGEADPLLPSAPEPMIPSLDQIDRDLDDFTDVEEQRWDTDPLNKFDHPREEPLPIADDDPQARLVTQSEQFLDSMEAEHWDMTGSTYEISRGSGEVEIIDKAEGRNVLSDLQEKDINHFNQVEAVLGGRELADSRDPEVRQIINDLRVRDMQETSEKFLETIGDSEFDHEDSPYRISQDEQGLNIVEKGPVERDVLSINNGQITGQVVEADLDRFDNLDRAIDQKIAYALEQVQQRDNAVDLDIDMDR